MSQIRKYIEPFWFFFFKLKFSRTLIPVKFLDGKIWAWIWTVISYCKLKQVTSFPFPVCTWKTVCVLGLLVNWISSSLPSETVPCEHRNGSGGHNTFVLFCFILSEGCPLLEQLNISWCDQVTKDGIQALVRGCGGLKALFLKGCTQVMLRGWLVNVRVCELFGGVWGKVAAADREDTSQNWRMGRTNTWQSVNGAEGTRWRDTHGELLLCTKEKVSLFLVTLSCLGKKDNLVNLYL